MTFKLFSNSNYKETYSLKYETKNEHLDFIKFIS